MTPRWTRSDGLALGGLVLLPLAWYFTPIFTDACYYLGDLIGQYAPWWTYGHESLRQGRVPLWNPHVFGGTPYHVNPENSLFYPLKLPLVFLSFFKAAAILRALNAAVASAGTYLLLRSWGTRPLSGLLGALMLAYGSFMAYEFVHIPYVNTAVWFPAQLLFLERLIRHPRVLDALLLAVVTACSFLGGSPGIFVTCQLTLVFFFASSLLRLALARRWARMGRLLGWLAFAVLLVVGLTAVLLVPALEFIGSTPRAGGLSDLSNFYDFALIPEAERALLFPWVQARYGAPHPPIYPIPFLNVPYLGLGAILLALFNIGSRRYARMAPLMLMVATFSVSMAMADRSGLLPWLMARAPLFGWFRWPHDYLLMTYLVLALAAATGFDVLWRERGDRLRRFGPILGGYLICALALEPRLSTVTVVLAIVTAVGVAIVLRPGRWPAALRARARLALGGAAVLLLAADLFLYSHELRVYLPRAELRMDHAREAIDRVRQGASHDRVAFAAPGGGTWFAGQERVFGRHVSLMNGNAPRSRWHLRGRKLTDFDRWLQRVDAPELEDWLHSRRAAFHDLDSTFWAYPVNASMLFGYQELSGYDPFVSARVMHLFRTIPFQRTWDLFGVKHVVTPHRLAYNGLERSFRAGKLHVWRNPTALPRAVVPERAEGSLDPQAILERMSEQTFDGGREALFETPLPPEPPPEERESDRGRVPGTATIVTYEPERVTVRARMHRDGFLVLHDVHHPGWRVRVDGNEAELLRANYVFRAVHLPGGEHDVEFVFRPRSFTWSAWISGFCWIGTALATGLAAWRGSRRRGRAS